MVLRCSRTPPILPSTPLPFAWRQSFVWTAWEWGVGVEIGVSGAEFSATGAKSLINNERIEQISRYVRIMGVRFLSVGEELQIGNEEGMVWDWNQEY